ncbi:Pectate lyase superfamily protein [compost metagenome]
MNAHVNAADFGFLPESSGMANAAALQRSLDAGGTVVVSQPGIYKLSRTVYIGSYTTLIFANDVFMQKVDEEGAFSHVILNKGALSCTYDEHISIHNLHIQVNSVDVRTFKDVFGLHGQLAFFYVKDLRIERFRCLDLGKAQYGIHICTFEDILIHDVIVKGDKDGVHLGRGKRFTIRDCVFETYDDAIALNAHDYDVGNPEMGWIEDGVVENCHDLARNEENNDTVGFFCRILSGAWKDWEIGMTVQKSDTVVSEGRLYRVKANPDKMVYVSTTKPVHESGTMVLDGIHWTMVQKEVVYTAGVRNVTFRDIFLHKARTGFSVHFDNDHYSRSYYPGAPVPMQKQIILDNIRVLHDHPNSLVSINTPVDVVTITNSSLQDNVIRFRGNKAMTDYLETRILMTGCVFHHNGKMNLVENTVENKKVYLKIAASVEMNSDFIAVLKPGPGSIHCVADLSVEID